MYAKYKSSITYHSKVMANIKVFADKQTDKRTDGRKNRWTNGWTKNYMPSIYRCGGIKETWSGIKGPVASL